MQVNQIMSSKVECVNPDTPLKDAAARMRDMDVGALPVCDKDRLAGMVTDRDITVRAVAKGNNPANTPVREAMTEDIFFCFEDQDVTEAARLMKENQIRRLPVLNRNKRLVGILSLGDLAVETHDDQLAGETLEAISEPAGAAR